MPGSTTKRQQAVAKEKEERTRKRRLSLPRVIDSVTSVNPEKVHKRRLSRRLSSSSLVLRSANNDSNDHGECGGVGQEGKGKTEVHHAQSLKSNNNNKENGEAERAVQGPTPYYKIVQERGGEMSPRQTRSATKKKRPSAFERPPMPHREGVMLFSPPDEAKIQRHEEEERAEQEAALARRVQEAKDDGRLLEFTPPRRRSVQPMDEDEDASDLTSDPTNLQPTVVNNKQMEQVTSELKKIREQQNEFLRAKQGEEGAQEKVDRLQREMLELVEEKTNLRNELDKANDTLRSNEVEMEELASDYGRVEAENGNLIERLNQATQREQELEALLNEKENEIVALQAQLEKVEEDRQLKHDATVKLQEEATDYQIQVHSLQQESQTTAKELETAYNEREKAKDARILELESKLETLKEDLDRLENDTLPKTEAMLQDSRGELKEVLDKHSKVLSQLAETEIQSTSLQQELEALKIEQSTRSAELEELATENERIEVENLEMTKSRDESKSKEEALVAEIEAMRVRVKHLEKEKIPETEARLAAAQDELAIEKEHVLKLEASLKECQQRVQLLEAQLADNELAYQEERQGFQQLENDRNVAESTHKDMVEKMEVDLAEKGKTLAALTSQVSELDKALGDTMEQLDHAKKEKEILHQKVTQMQAGIQQHDVEMEDAEARNEQSNSLIESLKKALEESKQNQEALKKEMANQYEHCQSLESQLRETSRERDEAKRIMEASGDQQQELHKQLLAGEQVRRDLHAKVMRLMGNIRVFVRVRPMTAEEEEKTTSAALNEKNGKDRAKNQPIFKFPSIAEQRDHPNSDFIDGTGSSDLTKRTIEIVEPSKYRGGLKERRKKHRFGFDDVFHQKHTQQDVWESTEPLIQSAIDGSNVSLFAYGQTGSGKTFTMLGEPGKEGIITRTIQKLFSDKYRIESMSKGASLVDIKVELLEIYNEHVFDLLAPAKGNAERKALKVCMTTNKVEGNRIMPANSEDECMKLLSVAQARRCVKSTSSNAESSRSHLVFTIHYAVLENDEVQRKGKLNICDLAGSERLSKSESHVVGGSLLKETQNINKSLSALSIVIEQLQEGQKTVAFRDSKLTSLLKDSLGGNSKTLAIVCCNPLTLHYHESLSSLRFAEKASKVELKSATSVSV